MARALLVCVLPVILGAGAHAVLADKAPAPAAAQSAAPQSFLGPPSAFDDLIASHAQSLAVDGRRIFRFDTFGSEAFWGGALRLHEAVGSVGPAALVGLGLKVDVD